MKKSPKEILLIERKHKISEEFRDLFSKLEKEHGQASTAEGLASFLVVHAIVGPQTERFLKNFVVLIEAEYAATVKVMKNVFGKGK